MRRYYRSKMITMIIMIMIVIKQLMTGEFTLGVGVEEIEGQLSLKGEF